MEALSNPATRVLTFGIYQVDLKAGELRRNGQLVKLQELPFQVLAMLLERRGDVVTREELRAGIWSGRAFGDFDHGLNKAINKIRHALRERPGTPGFIETVSRRGYRFIARVADEPQAPPSPPAAKIRLAVLPFENLTDDPSQDYFSDGLTEEMIAQLGRLDPQRLGVIARTSAMQYKRTGKDIAQIGRELEIDYILEGSVRRCCERLRITAQLIQVSDQTHLWAEIYDRQANDILAIQNEVARRIGASLALELMPEIGSPVRQGTLHPDAHEDYLRGRFLWNQRTESALLGAMGCFERARVEDPDYAPAHAGLAECYALIAWFGALPPHIAAPRAKTAAQQALALDDQLGEAHSALALMHFWYDWDWAGAEREFRRAIELNPSYAAAHHWYGAFLLAMGRLDEAEREQQLAQELDPLSLMIATSASDTFYYARRYEPAIRCLRGVLEREPRFSPAYFNLGRCYLKTGQYDLAADALEKATTFSGNHGALPALAHAVARAGDLARARSLLQDAQADSDGRYIASPNLALGYLGLGELDRTFEFLHHGLAERSYWLVLVNQEPLYDEVRNDPRFLALLRAIGFGGNDDPSEWR